MKKVIIGGTGFYDMGFLSNPRLQVVRTPFGSATVHIGTYQGEEIGFLPRHGLHHDLLAHQVNYKANIWGLYELGVNRIIGVSAVASFNPEISAGQLVIPDQLVDFTKNRYETFNLGSVDITEPYCPETRQVILEEAKTSGTNVHPKGTYLALEGPRYETAAEVRLWKKLGMDIVGMTNGTQAALAREVGICYGVICMPTNVAAGLDKTGPDLEKHRRVVQDSLPRLRELVLSTLMALPDKTGCPCADQAAQPIR